MAILGNLPEELMIEILSRLPPESLLRFKSVQKSWYALISSPEFATKQFSNSSTQRQHILLKRLSCKKKAIFSILQSPLSLNRFESGLDFAFPLDEQESIYLQIHGHSHGLVCLKLFDTGLFLSDIFLCNPTTREFRKLPRPSYPPDDNHHVAIGFGYDEKSSDFKVVKVVNSMEDSRSTGVEIYDLSRDRWRKIETHVGGYAQYWRPTFDMYHEGRYYWSAFAFADDQPSTTNLIRWFDMSEEVFGEIKVPSSVVKNGARIGFLDGFVAFSYHSGRDSEPTVDIWKMEKTAESDGVSWSKLFTFDFVYRVVQQPPLLFVNSDELLVQNYYGTASLYRIQTQQAEELIVNEESMEERSSFFEATFFVKSLISVKGGTNISY